MNRNQASQMFHSCLVSTKIVSRRATLTDACEMRADKGGHHIQLTPGYLTLIGCLSSSKVDDVLGDGLILGVLLRFPDAGLHGAWTRAVTHAQHVQSVGLRLPAKVNSRLFHVYLDLLCFTARIG